jgi:hypothetical protein
MQFIANLIDNFTDNLTDNLIDNLIDHVIYNILRPVFLGFVIIISSSSTALFAQQTIVNLPSADQTPQGHLFILHETQVRPWQPDSYWRSTNFITYGITNNFEACATVYNLDFVGANKPYTSLGLGFKGAHQFLEQEAPELEAKLTAGAMFTTSFEGKGTGVWTYAHLSVRLPVLHTRVAAGISKGSRQIFGGTSEAFISTENINFIGSVEHPITKNFGVVLEWFSGKHEMGDLVPGVIFHTKELVMILGYKIGNGDGNAGGNGIIFEIGRTF